VNLSPGFRVCICRYPNATRHGISTPPHQFAAGDGTACATEGQAPNALRDDKSLNSSARFS